MQQTAVAVTSGSGHFRTKCAAAKQGVANLHIPLTPDRNYDPSPRVSIMARLLSDRRALSWLAAALSIYLLALAAPSPTGLSHAGQAVLGVALAGVALWASEAVPLGFAAVFVLVLLGTTPSTAGSTTFRGFAVPVVFFLMGAVALGTAVESTGLAGRVASLLVRSAGGSPSRLYVQMLASLPGLAFLLPSAITRNAVLIPAYRDTLNAMGIARSDRTGRALMLALGVLNPLASSAILTGGVTSMTASAIIPTFPGCAGSF
jgi:solute carrier family 13 (sodium-dependent dicarboxylate transporter), member 2/3/5